MADRLLVSAEYDHFAERIHSMPEGGFGFRHERPVRIIDALGERLQRQQDPNRRTSSVRLLVREVREEQGLSDQGLIGGLLE